MSIDYAEGIKQQRRSLMDTTERVCDVKVVDTLFSAIVCDTREGIS